MTTNMRRISIVPQAHRPVVSTNRGVICARSDVCTPTETLSLPDLMCPRRSLSVRRSCGGAVAGATLGRGGVRPAGERTAARADGARGAGVHRRTGGRGGGRPRSSQSGRARQHAGAADHTGTQTGERETGTGREGNREWDGREKGGGGQDSGWESETEARGER